LFVELLYYVGFSLGKLLSLLLQGQFEGPGSVEPLFTSSPPPDQVAAHVGLSRPQTCNCQLRRAAQGSLGGTILG
jgi:hypothetical protein